MALVAESFKSIEIFNEPYFIVNVVIDNQSCNMSFIWNDKVKRYCTTLVKTNGTVVFEGVVINPITIFPINSVMKVNGLNGLFTLWPYDLSMIDTEETIKNWKDYYFLFYTITV